MLILSLFIMPSACASIYCKRVTIERSISIFGDTVISIIDLLCYGRQIILEFLRYRTVILIYQLRHFQAALHAGIVPPVRELAPSLWANRILLADGLGTASYSYFY